jgi:hypothetical protein
MSDPAIPTPAEREALNATLFATDTETGFGDGQRPPCTLAPRHRRMDTREQQPSHPHIPTPGRRLSRYVSPASHPFPR